MKNTPNVENISDKELNKMTNAELISVKNALRQVVIRKELIKEIKHLQSVIVYDAYRYPDYYEPNMMVDTKDNFTLGCSLHESAVAEEVPMCRVA